MYNYINNKHFYSKLLFLLSIILLIINIFLLILGYHICKWLYKKVYNEYFSVDNYTKYQKEILKKYGNNKVNKIYIVKFNILDKGQLCNNPLFKKLLCIYLPNGDIFLENNKNILNHCSIICKLKTNKGYKFILIEKNASIRIKLNFNIKENKILKSVKLEKEWKFKDILNDTKKRMGKKKFFYWHICKNNCQHWVKEILITLGKFNKKNKEFIIQDMNSLDIFPKTKLNIITIFTNLLNLLY